MTMRKTVIALSLLEAASFLSEQEAAAPPPAAPEPPPAVLPATPSPEAQNIPTDEETGEALTLDVILGRLNIIRSGKTFKDPEAYGKLISLYKDYSAEDKVKLNKQLKSIGAIVQDQTLAADGSPPAPGQAPLAPAPPPPPPAV